MQKESGTIRFVIRFFKAVLAVLSFLTTVLCMRDALTVRDELAAEQKRETP